MRQHGRTIALAALCALAAGWAAAAATDGGSAPGNRRSGYESMGPSTQAMQNDDAQNPAMLWVHDGQALWNRPAGASDRSCASCHGAAPVSMRGVAARYPAFDARLQRPLNLGQRINQCRQQHQQAQPLRADSQERLAIESYIALQSRGLPLKPPDDARLATPRENGRQRYLQRIGQLNLSCAQCHDERWDRRLGGSIIAQAHPTGYPIYRLEWQAMGSLQRRLRNCMTGVRADPYAWDSDELVELELYLAVRARGMLLEAPGVRP